MPSDHALHANSQHFEPMHVSHGPVQYGTPNPANPAQSESVPVAVGGIPVWVKQLTGQGGRGGPAIRVKRK